MQMRWLEVIYLSKVMRLPNNRRAGMEDLNELMYAF